MGSPLRPIVVNIFVSYNTKKNKTSKARTYCRGNDTATICSPCTETSRSKQTPQRADSTPAHCEKGKLAVEPDEQQALTYLNHERKVFWAGICLFPSSYPARYFRNEGFSLTGKEIELPWQPRAQHPFIYIGFDVRLAKSFNRSGNFFFSGKTVSSVDMVRGMVFRSET